MSLWLVEKDENLFLEEGEYSVRPNLGPNTEDD
jgi:hypothetical protein